MKKHRIFKSLILVGILGLNGVVQADLNDGLVAYYPFNGNANDESGSENNGVVHRATLTEGRFEDIESADSFDGVDGYINGTHSSSLNLTTVTLSAWVNTQSLTGSNGNMFIHKWTEGYYNSWNYALGVNHDGNAWVGFKNRTPTVISPAALGVSNIVDSNWHLITGVIVDASFIKIYVDGSLEGVTEISHTPVTNSNPIRIGKTQDSIQYWSVPNAKISDIRIYNRALSEIEIKELYNEGSTPNIEESVDTTTISLENKSFGGNETPDEMRQRYKNNIMFYNSYPEYHHPEEIVIDFISLYCIGMNNTFGVGIETIYSAINLDLTKYLSNLKPIFYGIQCYNKIFRIIGKTKAHLMLSHFLTGSGSNIEVDMMSLFLENRILTNNFIISIRNNIEKGVMNGRYKINQSDWVGGGYSDWNLALGTIILEWETNGEDLILYLNDKYSFDINPNSSEINSTFRWTSPLYIEAANLILQGKASDFFMVGKLKVPLKDIY